MICRESWLHFKTWKASEHHCVLANHEAVEANPPQFTPDTTQHNSMMEQVQPVALALESRADERDYPRLRPTTFPCP